MDNLAHTLAGAALGEAGLKRRTGLAMPTLMIAANLPDLDAIGLFFGATLDWRRGWTHGPVALLILPPLLALLMLGFDRWQARRGKRPERRLPVRFGWLLVLAYIGILTHPLLDFLNTYGIRFLMPFSERWFYGDTLFVVDIWMWSLLAVGVWLARRRSSARPAVAALVAVSLYVGAMWAGGRWAERIAAREIEARGIGAPETVLASPDPANPFHRDIIFRIDGAYGFGTLKWTRSPRLELEAGLEPANMDDPAVAQAAAEHRWIAGFLYWSRMPYARIERRGGRAHVLIRDARYRQVAREAGFVTGAVVEED